MFKNADAEAGRLGELREKTAALYVKFAGILAILLSCYHIYTSVFGFPGALKHRAMFCMLTFVIGFLIMPMFKHKGREFKPLILDLVLAALSAIVFSYLWINYLEIYNRIGSPNQTDILFGCTATALVIIFARRRCGIPIIVLPVLMLLYTLFGQYIRGPMGHNLISLRRLVNGLYLGTTGIFSEPIGAAANYVVIFCIFGKFLEYTGCGDYFIKLAYSLVGRVSSGAALTAVVASGLFGMMSGSASANVTTTGTFTIPLMKKQGYEGNFAGAVEAVASTGGQIMPPVMGASAFIIAETLQMSYSRLMACAIWPALIYYIATAFSVHLEAKKNNIRPNTDVPAIGKTLKEGWFLLMPIVVLILSLCVLRRSVYRSAIYAIVTAVVCSFLHPDRKYRFTLKRLLSLLKESGLSVLTIAAATASAGIVIGCISITGLGVKLAIFITHLAGNNLLVALILVWLVAVMLGTGLPTSAAYITTAALLVSTLNQLGLDKLAAHMFCFYAAIISNLTPPVCIASYTAAGISGGDSWKTAIQGFWLGLPGPFLVPFMFAFRPGLLLINAGADPILIDLLSCLVACLMLSVATRGYLFDKVPWWQRACALAAGLLFITDAPNTNLIGLALFAIVLVPNAIEAFVRKKKAKAA